MNANILYAIMTPMSIPTQFHKSISNPYWSAASTSYSLSMNSFNDIASNAYFIGLRYDIHPIQDAKLFWFAKNPENRMNNISMMGVIADANLDS